MGGSRHGAARAGWRPAPHRSRPRAPGRAVAPGGASVPPEMTEGGEGVLISHAHADHLDAASLRRLPADVAFVAPGAAATWLRRRGFRNVATVTRGDRTALAGVPVTVTPAEHDGRRRPYGPKAEAVGFLVGPEPAIYVAGDTDLYPAMADLAGRVDVALLPIWGWGRSLGPGHLDPERAAEAAALIRPRTVVPVHWGTLGAPHHRLSAAERMRPAERFATAMARRAPGVHAARLAPGAILAPSAGSEP